MIILHKTLPFFLSPIFFVILFLLLAIVFGLKRYGIIGLAIIIVSSNPIISQKLVIYLENGYKPLKIDEIQNSSAIVVLGGMLRAVPMKNGYKYEWTESSDRFFAGVELIAAGKAPVIIFTRAQLPWEVGGPEGEYLRSLAKKLGIEDSSILLTENVQNTEQEAVAVSKLLDPDTSSIILVTSAYHMLRASKIFSSFGFKVNEYPVNFRSQSHNKTLIDYIPSANAFSNTSYVIRELIGRTYYRVRHLKL